MKNKKKQIGPKSIISIVCSIVIILSGIVIALKYFRPTINTVVQAIPTIAESANTIYEVIAVDPQGTILTDPNGRALYTYAPDPENESVCINGCSEEWIPYHVGQLPNMLPAHFTIITRTDRTKQYAYNGKPLYYFVQDTEIGSTQGEGINGFWSLARP